MRVDGLFLSSGSYVYCTGDAVNKIDPWGLGERLDNPQSPRPSLATNHGRDMVDAPDDHERAKTNQDEMKEMFSRSGQWATNEQNRQEHQRGFAVKGGLPFFGARAGGDGFFPQHFNENGLGMSETRNATTSTTQTQHRSTTENVVRATTGTTSVVNGTTSGLIEAAAQSSGTTWKFNSGVVKYVKVSKILGGVGLVAETVYNGATFYNNPSTGNFVRAVVPFAATVAALFIPGVGWAVSATITTVDIVWGDQIYRAIDDGLAGR